MMYVQDYDETYPLAQRDPDPTEITAVSGASANTPVTYQWVVNPYVKNGSQMVTANTGAFELAGGLWACPDFPVTASRNYGGNLHILGDYSKFAYSGGWGNKYPSATLAQINYPASKVLIAEKGYMGSDPSQKDFSSTTIDTFEWNWVPSGSSQTTSPTIARSNTDNDSQSNPYPWASVEPRFRHQGMCNFIFADGHAKPMSLGTVQGWSGWCKYMYSPGGMNVASWYPYNGSLAGDPACAQWEN